MWNPLEVGGPFPCETMVFKCFLFLHQVKVSTARSTWCQRWCVFDILWEDRSIFLGRK